MPSRRGDGRGLSKHVSIILAFDIPVYEAFDFSSIAFCDTCYLQIFGAAAVLMCLRSGMSPSILPW